MRYGPPKYEGEQVPTSLIVFIVLLALAFAADTIGMIYLMAKSLGWLK